MIRDVLAFILTIIVGVGTLFIIANEYGEYRCEQYTKITEVQTYYVQFDVCYVMYGNRFVRWEEYLNLSMARDGLDRSY